MSVTYYASAKRFCRQYRAPVLTATYASLTSAVEAASCLQTSPWKFIDTYHASSFPTHAETADNPADRDYFDAYAMCAEHADGIHRAYAGCVAFRIELPDAFIGATLESLSVAVSSDPYNPAGARVSLATSLAGVNQPVEDWDDIREGVAYASGQAPRTVSADGTLWYGATATATVTPAGGLVLGKYVWVYLTLENYERARNGWLEGASKINPLFTLVTSAAVSGYVDGDHVGGGYDVPAIELAQADVASAPLKMGYSTGSSTNWPYWAYMHSELFGGYFVADLATFSTPEKLATLTRELLISLPGTLSTVATAVAGAAGALYQSIQPNNGAGWANAQYGLAANVVRVDGGTDYVGVSLSHYMTPLVPKAGLTPTVMRLTNGATALDLNGASVQITPWFIPTPCDPTTKNRTFWWFALRGLAAQAAFWLGSEASVTGSIVTGESTPVTYALTATRIGSPTLVPSSLAAGGSMYIDITAAPTSAGMLILVPWLIDQGDQLSSGTPKAGLGTLALNPAAVTCSGSGWRPGITLL